MSTIDLDHGVLRRNLMLYLADRTSWDMPHTLHAITAAPGGGHNITFMAPPSRLLYTQLQGLPGWEAISRISQSISRAKSLSPGLSLFPPGTGKPLGIMFMAEAWGLSVPRVPGETDAQAAKRIMLQRAEHRYPNLADHPHARETVLATAVTTDDRIHVANWYRGGDTTPDIHSRPYDADAFDTVTGPGELPRSLHTLLHTLIGDETNP